MNIRINDDILHKDEYRIALIDNIVVRHITTIDGKILSLTDEKPLFDYSKKISESFIMYAIIEDSGKCTSIYTGNDSTYTASILNCNITSINRVVTL